MSGKRGIFSVEMFWSTVAKEKFPRFERNPTSCANLCTSPSGVWNRRNFVWPPRNSPCPMAPEYPAPMLHPSPRPDGCTLAHRDQGRPLATEPEIASTRLTITAWAGNPESYRPSISKWYRRTCESPAGLTVSASLPVAMAACAPPIEVARGMSTLAGHGEPGSWTRLSASAAPVTSNNPSVHRMHPTISRLACVRPLCYLARRHEASLAQGRHPRRRPGDAVPPRHQGRPEGDAPHRRHAYHPADRGRGGEGRRRAGDRGERARKIVDRGPLRPQPRVGGRARARQQDRPVPEDPRDQRHGAPDQRAPEGAAGAGSRGARRKARGRRRVVRRPARR